MNTENIRPDPGVVEEPAHGFFFNGPRHTGSGSDGHAEDFADGGIGHELLDFVHDRRGPCLDANNSARVSGGLGKGLEFFCFLESYAEGPFDEALLAFGYDGFDGVVVFISGLYQQEIRRLGLPALAYALTEQTARSKESALSASSCTDPYALTEEGRL